jgi:hypothetical protein
LVDEIAPQFSIFLGFVEFTVFQAMFSNYVGPEFLVYFTTLTMLIIGIASAAFVAVKTTSAAVNFSMGFYFQYHGAGAEGDIMYAWELIFVSLWLLWSASLTIGMYYEAAQIIDAVSAREKGVLTDGTFGSAMSYNNAMKASTLMMVMAFGAWISAYVLGETADELIGWFDQYSDDTKTEGRDKTDGDYDTDGTAVYYDLLYHSITAGYAYVVLSAMMVGGGWFFNEFNNIDYVLPDSCDLDKSSASTYSGLKSLFPTLRDMSYADCQSSITNAFNTIDLNKDGMISECEEAKFLLGIGNTEAYAKSYPASYSLGDITKMCEWIVPDGFDQKPTTQVNFLQDILNMWPLNLFTSEMGLTTMTDDDSSA